jgi:3'-5' exoribonuclease
MENKGFYLNALPSSGEVTLLAALTEKELRPKRSGGVYLHLKLADRTGEIDGKAWDRPEEIARTVDCNAVVKIRGNIEAYNGRPQLVVSRIRNCRADEYDSADFYPASARDPDEMYGQLLAYIELVSEAGVRELLRGIVTDGDIAAKLKITPAALKIHHAWRSGLLEHIVSMCEYAVLLSGKEQRLNLDWLIAGSILHDIGKIDTLELQGVRFSYTTAGQLLEHIALGLGLLERFASRFPGLTAESTAMLQHLVVSHHGDPDKGALRRPMTPEAIALSILDLLDARLEQAYSVLAQTPHDQEFSPYVPSLERQLFRGMTPRKEETGHERV